MIYPPLTERQHAAILTGLRLYQALKESRLTSMRVADIEDVATNGGQFRPLPVSEIELLCERLNKGRE